MLVYPTVLPASFIHIILCHDLTHSVSSRHITRLRAHCAAMQNGEHEDLGEGDEAAVKAYESWQPDRVASRVPPEEGGNPQASDIIATLISIYGSKELFINEYRCVRIGWGVGLCF